MKISIIKIGVIICILLLTGCGNMRDRSKNERFITYKTEITSFSPIIKWINDSDCRIYIHRADVPFTSDYVQIKPSGLRRDMFIQVYETPISIFYNEKNPKDIYVILNTGDKVMDVKSDYYNIFIDDACGNLTSHGEKYLFRDQNFYFFLDSLRNNMQYAWYIYCYDSSAILNFNGNERIKVLKQVLGSHK